MHNLDLAAIFDWAWARPGSGARLLLLLLASYGAASAVLSLWSRLRAPAAARDPGLSLVLEVAASAAGVQYVLGEVLLLLEAAWWWEEPVEILLRCPRLREEERAALAGWTARIQRGGSVVVVDPALSAAETLRRCRHALILWLELEDAGPSLARGLGALRRFLLGPQTASAPRAAVRGR
ncbi:protein of unknown function [Candidatus Hydrogenisulfobacillus filiaventi]|uniref:Uncharacterized protein n=1 Tax=Candidatus Hydrogenisulfobacillus filiaventi TaxID=2707344 RepID=A0A6F8ZEQ9_9FIRM|nr:protein of unknown function [Candidatus Hydrogenisulfobacillus filiaventi]